MIKYEDSQEKLHVHHHHAKSKSRSRLFKLGLTHTHSHKMRTPVHPWQKGVTRKFLVLGVTLHYEKYKSKVNVPYT